MISPFLEDERTNVAQRLRLEHERIRMQLDAAVTQEGQVGKAARRLADVCLPHFELEEMVILPFLSKLHEASFRRELVPLSSDLHAQLISLRDEYNNLKRHHQSMRSAVKMLLAAAYKEGNHDIAELAHLLSNHERIEHDLEVAVHELAVLRSH